MDNNTVDNSTDKTWTLYMHVNKSNDKKYIGITCQDPVIRWGKDGNGYKKQVFGKAIEKYGWDNFNHIILKTHLTKEEAINMEIEYIRKYGSHVSQHGYNVTYGGEGHLNNRVYQFDLNGKFIQLYNGVSEAARAINKADSNISVVCSGLVNQAGGYIWRYEKDVDDPHEFYKTIDPDVFDRFYPVYQFDMNQKYLASFDSANDARIKTGIFSTSILDCCRGEYRHAGGYIWKFQKDVENPYEFYKIPIDLKSRKNEYVHKVMQFDLDGNYLATYNSPSVASQKYGCDIHTITYACSGRTQSGVGFLWCYEEDYDGSMKPYIKPKPANIKPVIQYDMNMNELFRYESIAEAGRQCNIQSTQIRDNCLHKQHTCHGFIFKYASEV